MGPIEFGRRRIYIYIAAAASIFLLYNLFFFGRKRYGELPPLPGQDSYHYGAEPSIPPNEDEFWDDPLPTMTNPGTSIPTTTEPPKPAKPDSHPISRLMKEADDAWRAYESGRSLSFRETVEKYRSKYGRHPPPGFKEWYLFARKKNVWNIDDFEQVMDDLRPFWGIEPSVIRSHAAHMWENDAYAAAVIHVRGGKVARVDNPAWRSETMQDCIERFIEYLPDMDIVMNRMDQPRLLVPWEDLQAHLTKEYETRAMPPEVLYNFTLNQNNMTDMTIDPKHPELDTSERLDPGWFGAPGKQYMDIASKACPPESPARSGMSIEEANALYKDPLGGIVTNFNLSTDLCTVGPAIQDLHGMLYSSSSISASYTLVPIFSECKVSVNNDILFPANMYWRHDERYDYNPTDDVPWREKADNMIWRGVTSGGVQLVDNWETMHRQRLVRLTNGTHLAIADQKVHVLVPESASDAENVTYKNDESFDASAFALEHTDIGFTETWGCIPDCKFYDDIFKMKPQQTLTSQFKSKYLIDVDGHSFSGRWHAFLQSKSIGFKATIFREWHDSRLFPWRHFVPLDNRYDDLYSLLTYFIGYGGTKHLDSEEPSDSQSANPEVHIPSHVEQAKQIARQSREWSTKVLRRDDIEVYMFRLLLEYGRIIDDNRDRIGYSGDGSELDHFDGSEEGEASKWGVGQAPPT